MFEHLYTEMLDQMFDMYDRHLRFLSQFDDLALEVSELSQAFVEEHDNLMAVMAGCAVTDLANIQRMMDVADRIMYLVHQRGEKA